MKTLLFLAATAAAVALLPGCSRGSATSAIDAIPEPAPAVTYKSGRGLRLSPAATVFISLQTADLTTRDSAGAKGASTIPAAALLRTAKGDFVYVANGGWFLRTAVVIGATDASWLEVKDGLYEGDIVVTRGTRALWLAEIQAVNGGVACTEGH